MRGVSLYCFFFFFQAEDGIRDIGVTGVQTCALPISREAVVEEFDDLDVFVRTSVCRQDLSDSLLMSLWILCLFFRVIENFLQTSGPLSFPVLNLCCAL